VTMGWNTTYEDTVCQWRQSAAAIKSCGRFYIKMTASDGPRLTIIFSPKEFAYNFFFSGSGDQPTYPTPYGNCLSSGPLGVRYPLLVPGHVKIWKKKIEKNRKNSQKNPKYIQLCATYVGKLFLLRYWLQHSSDARNI
jgi:hypothetical protein